jgi:hypothetical protein
LTLEATRTRRDLALTLEGDCSVEVGGEIAPSAPPSFGDASFSREEPRRCVAVGSPSALACEVRTRVIVSRRLATLAGSLTLFVDVSICHVIRAQGWGELSVVLHDAVVALGEHVPAPRSASARRRRT